MVNLQDLTKLEEKLRKEMKQEVQKIENRLNKRVTEIENKFATQLLAKDEQIKDLTKELAEVTKSAEFIDDKIDKSDAIYNENMKIEDKRNVFITQTVNELKEKTRDMEDRQRRDNLVFFNVNETNNPSEDCEKLVMKELVRCGIFNNDVLQRPITERAHRLGKFRQGADKSRPIILKMSSHRAKQHILYNAKNLSGSNMNVSEDYSKDTVELHKILRARAKTAYDKNDSNMVSYRVMYRKLSLRFKDTTTHQEYTRMCTMRDINDKPAKWYKL
jgi:hypothetical protein